MRVLARVRRILFVAALVAVFLVLAGATYQGAATALERRQFPHPGRLIDVGGHQLHIYCLGEGTPTIVLEAPAMGMSAAWGWVQPEIARISRVCSYDRAGLGWSEAGDRPYQPAAVGPQLHALLEGAREAAPYVLVGHGFGAALASAYAARFRPQVAGLVLVDAPAPQGTVRQSRLRLANASPWLARAGVLRATRLLSSQAEGLPPVSAGPLAAFLNRPDHLTRAARELARWNETVAFGAAAPLDAALPVVHVEAAGPEQTALLTDAGQAMAVSAAIARLVDLLRSGGD